MKGGLRTLLLAQSAITDIVGAAGVHVGNAAQGQPLPYVAIQQDGSDEFNSLTETGRFRAVDFELDCKGRNGGEAAALAETLREFIQDYAGPAGGQVIDAVILDEEFDSVEKPVNGSDQKTFVVTLALTIQYHPA